MRLRSGRSLREGNSNPLQYSCLGNPMDRGAWGTIVYGVTKRWTALSDETTTNLHTLHSNYTSVKNKHAEDRTPWVRVSNNHPLQSSRMSYLSIIWSLENEGFKESRAIATFLCCTQNVFLRFKTSLKQMGMTEDEMVGWHHQHNGHGFGWTLGVGVGQGGLACCGPWGRKELDTTEQLNWTECFQKNRAFFFSFIIKS